MNKQITYNITYLKYENKMLYLKKGKVITELGLITTRKGKLTREQKLRAVANIGEWVKI